MKIRSKLILFCLIIALFPTIFGFMVLNELYKISEPLTKEIPQSIDELSTQSHLDGLAQFIRYYDEILTQSARNYAFTEDKKWEERYKTVEPQLDDIIKQAIEEGDEKDKEFFSSIDEANTALVEMEYKAINLVNEGKKDEAIRILESDEYWNYKQIYENGLKNYVERRGSQYNQALVTSVQTLDLITENTNKQLTENTQFITASAILVAAVAAGIAFYISYSISKPIVKLRDAAKTIAKGEWDAKIITKGDDEIHELTDALDSMVKSLKKSEELHSIAEEKYKSLYENAPDLYRTIDLNGIIIDCNKQYAERLGYSKDEIIGMSIFQNVEKSNIDAMRESFEIWKRTGSVKDREIWFKTKDGSTFPALVSATNLYDKNGKLIGSNTIIKDITDLYKARIANVEKEKMKSNLEEIKKIEKQKDEFSSMISHELRSPLNLILGFCELLKDSFTSKNLDSQQLDSIKEIHDNALRLEKLITDVLDAQRLNMNRLSFNIASFNGGELMNKLSKEFSPLMDEKQIQFRVNKEEMILESDESKIRQVLDNLITNAMDFVPQKGGKIKVGLLQQDENVVFYVKDNGIGIPKEKQNDLFKKFYQVDTSYTRKHGGTGLGLVICKGIVEGLQGKIWLESDKGAGSTFYFSIPKNYKKTEVKQELAAKISSGFSN